MAPFTEMGRLREDRRSLEQVEVLGSVSTTLICTCLSDIQVERLSRPGILGEGQCQRQI